MNNTNPAVFEKSIPNGKRRPVRVVRRMAWFLSDTNFLGPSVQKTEAGSNYYNGEELLGRYVYVLFEEPLPIEGEQGYILF